MSKDRTEELMKRILDLEKDQGHRKQVLETLWESEQKYKMLTENPVVGIFIHQDRKFVYVNQRLAEMHGYRPEEIIGQQFFMLVSPQERTTITRQESRVKKDPAPKKFEIMRVKKGGQPFWAEVITARIEYRGKPAVMGYVIDISERKQTEAQLRQHKKFTESLINSMNEGFVVLDCEGVHLRVNPAFCRMIGFTESEVTGAGPPHPYWPEEEIESIEKAFKDALDGELQDRELTFKNKSGRRFPVFVSPSCVIDESGSMRYFATVRDISAVRQADEALKRSKADLEVLVRQRTAELAKRADQLSRLTLELGLAEARERRRIAKIMHDDLQQLLVGAQIHLALLSESCEPDQRKNIQKVDKLVRESLQVSRTLTSELSLTVLHQQGIVPAFRLLAEHMKKNHYLNVELDLDPGVVVSRFDFRVLLFECTRELLFNAVKHAKVDSARLSVTRGGANNLHIVVSDRGVGFDPDGASKQVDQRTGLGLFTIRERLGSIGGCFEVDSAPGRGAVCTLIAPLPPDEPTSAE